MFRGELFETAVAETAFGILTARFANDQIAGVARDPVAIRRFLDVNDGNAFILRLDDLNRSRQVSSAARAMIRTVSDVFVIHIDLSSFDKLNCVCSLLCRLPADSRRLNAESAWLSGKDRQTKTLNLIRKIERAMNQMEKDFPGKILLRARRRAAMSRRKTGGTPRRRSSVSGRCDNSADS